MPSFLQYVLKMDIILKYSKAAMNEIGTAKEKIESKN